MAPAPDFTILWELLGAFRDWFPYPGVYPTESCGVSYHELGSSVGPDWARPQHSELPHLGMTSSQLKPFPSHCLPPLPASPGPTCISFTPTSWHPVPQVVIFPPSPAHPQEEEESTSDASP